MLNAGFVNLLKISTFSSVTFEWALTEKGGISADRKHIMIGIFLRLVHPNVSLVLFLGRTGRHIESVFQLHVVRNKVLTIHGLFVCFNFLFDPFFLEVFRTKFRVDAPVHHGSGDLSSERVLVLMPGTEGLALVDALLHLLGRHALIGEERRVAYRGLLLYLLVEKDLSECLLVLEKHSLLVDNDLLLNGNSSQ